MKHGRIEKSAVNVVEYIINRERSPSEKEDGSR